MNTIKKTVKSMKIFFENIAKARMQSTLLNMGREWVEDKGFSYDALKLGVSEWPWRQSPEKIAEEKEIRRSIRDLKSYNDRELRDIGIPRSEIEYAVRYGRREEEFDTDRAA